MSPTAQLIILVIGFSIFGLAFAAYLARWVLRHTMGSEAMQRISNAIKEGAEAFLRRQNRTILTLAVVFAAVLFIGYAFVRSHREFDPVGSSLQLATWITLSFVFGALCSVFAGYVGMWVSIRSNIRTATAALSSINDALRIAMRGGAVSGLLVVAMSLLGVSGLYALVSAVGGVEPTKIPLLIVGYGFGASFVALFAQLGGGIYTKAADVGADLVGKVEAGIPEDDPRNPAVIADLVGDNVGDCAGRGADLFESTAAENIGAMILGASLAAAADHAGLAFSQGIVGVMMFPLVARAFGIIASIVGIMMVRMDKDEKMDPMQALNRGYYFAVVLAMVGVRRGHLLAAQLPQRAQRLVALLPVRDRRRAHVGRLRLHHPVLHRVPLPPGAEHRRGVQDRSGHQHHRRHRRRPRVRLDARPGDGLRAAGLVLPGRQQRACRTRGCSAPRSPPWVCWPPPRTSWRWTPSAPSPTTPAASSRCRSSRRPCARRPTGWMRSATPPRP